MIKRTFNLPSVIGSRTITGTNDINGIGYKDVGGLPNIMGDFALSTGVNGSGTWLKADYAWGAFTSIASGNTATLTQAGTFTSSNKIRLDASSYSNIYNSNNSEVQPKRIMMYHIVKY